MSLRGPLMLFLASAVFAGSATALAVAEGRTMEGHPSPADEQPERKWITDRLPVPVPQPEVPTVVKITPQDDREIMTIPETLPPSP